MKVKKTDSIYGVKNHEKIMKYIKNYEQLNEKWFTNKKKNDDLIKTINIVLEKDDDEDMYELFKDIMKRSYFNFTDDEAEKAIEILRNGEFEMHPNIYADINSSQEIRSALESIAKLLETTNLKNIRVYLPNSGSGHFKISDSTMLFHI
jgi:mannitol-1-phosphate/altronate dehydrogenase